MAEDNVRYRCNNCGQLLPALRSETREEPDRYVTTFTMAVCTCRVPQLQRPLKAPSDGDSNG